jgi:hypothetical protein
VIRLDAPVTNHFVQCRLADATPVNCVANQLITQSDGSTLTTSVFVPAAGGTIQSSVMPVGDVQWSGTSIQTTPYEGSVTSTGTTGTVTITLDRAKTGAKDLHVICEANGGDTSVPEAIISCRLDIRVWDYAIGAWASNSYNLTPGLHSIVALPPVVSRGSPSVILTAYGSTESGEFVSSRLYESYADLVAGKLVRLRLNLVEIG